MLCMDTNFHLKNQMVSSYSQDPGLGIGQGYFIPKDAYDKYVLNHTTDEDVGPLFCVWSDDSWRNLV